MNRIIQLLAAVLTVCVVTAFASPADAQRHPGSFGIGLGAATVAGGLSIKTDTGGATSLQVAVGSWRGYGGDWRFGADSIGVGADFLYNMPSFAGSAPIKLAWNYGLGAGVGVTDGGGAVIGGTGVIGLEFLFSPAPIDFVIEYRPGIYLGSVDFDVALIDFTGHLRIWF